MVRVHVFNRQGDLVGPVDSPKLILNDAQWRQRLTPEQFEVLRSSGTERPFCGALLDNKMKGVYTCAGCGLPLFSSDAKFHSGTGWPSFFQPIAEGNVAQKHDHSYGMSRTEINCARCDGHLGHVFDDGPRPTGLRFCLNSASLNFTPSEKLATLADPAAGTAGLQKSRAPMQETKAQPQQAGSETQSHSFGAMQTAVFAGGCFWCTEAVFEQLEGVSDVESGYAGGAEETANYERVCDGDTGHAEAIRITYDPNRISYDRLLDVFFDSHDPTQLNRQGNDYGAQYRSAIFYADEQQKQVAQAKIAQLTQSHAFSKPIVTTLEPLAAFYTAEQYHQNYARNNPLQPYIQAAAIPKVCKIREKHPGLLKKNSAAGAT
ncbi:MAG TPA: bifunctional methionine sulfoxide reductase B/A protein [Pirellulales bacterium]|nr:bifunctional methionine sulfoxide reductase B/A protein [Pirellulales bacterium]